MTSINELITEAQENLRRAYMRLHPDGPAACAIGEAVAKLSEAKFALKKS